MKRGIATFTLDHGHCPRWLFERMVKLGREMTRVLIEEYGPDEYIARLADPAWFQSLGTVLAFDWNASGLTTILTAALKEAIRGQEQELGVFICGGKGKTSRKTPEQIQSWGGALGLPDQQVDDLEYNSRMSAKVDSALVQDGYQLYHHSFMFSRNGAWTVIQQGMNQESQTARRYHWHSANLHDLIVEPHAAIAAQMKHNAVLNLTAGEGEKNRATSLELSKAGTVRLLKDLQLLDKHATGTSRLLKVKAGDDQLTLLTLRRGEFNHHPVEQENFSKSRYLQKILSQLAEEQPRSYAGLLRTPGVGPKTVRALSLVAEVIYGAPASRRDPARYSFAHGGKDATPYPVDRPTYDQTIEVLQRAVGRTKLESKLKNEATARLQKRSNLIAAENLS